MVHVNWAYKGMEKFTYEDDVHITNSFLEGYNKECEFMFHWKAI